MESQTGRPKTELNLLSFDGGGVRGVSSLAILRSLMYSLQQKLHPRPKSLPRPCDYFDLIAGTSTGGLIAVMLGVLKMDVDDCIRTYREVAQDIFPTEGFLKGNKVAKHAKGLTGNARFSAKPLEMRIKKLVSDYMKARSDGEGGKDREDDESLGNTKLDFETEGDLGEPTCKVFVCVTEKTTESQFRLRNYHGEEPAANCSIWEALRATSAAPLIFDPITIVDHSGIEVEYVDGGLGMNNPVRALVDEAKSIWNPASGFHVGSIVSIGTGQQALHTMGSTELELVETIKRIALDAEETAEEFAREAKTLESHPFFKDVKYFRFNVPHGVGDVPLEDWRDIPRMNQATRKYMTGHVARMAADAWTEVIMHQSSLVIDKFGSLPSSSSLYGRQALLSRISHILDETSASRNAIVLLGMPGIGKTQIAIHYAWTRGHCWDRVLWINAASKGSFLRCTTKLAVQPGTGHNVGGSQTITNFSEDISESHESVPIVKSWLSSPQSGKWLLILDGATAQTIGLFSLILGLTKGKIIVTTSRYKLGQRLEAGYDMVPVEVSPLDKESSSRLLMESFSQPRREKEDPRKVYELTKLLGFVPLAIRQAAAMMRLPLSAEKYTSLFQARFDKIRDYQTEDVEIHYKQSWSIFVSLDLICSSIENDDDTVNLLKLSTFFGTPPIPVSIFNAARRVSVRRSDGFRIPLWLQDLAEDSSLWTISLTALRNYCLLDIKYDYDEDISEYTMNHLIKSWIQARMNDEERAELKTLVFCITIELVNSSDDWRASSGIICRYSGHINVAIEILKGFPQSSLDAPDGHLFHTYAPYAECLGQFSLALGQLEDSTKFYTMALQYETLMCTESSEGLRKRIMLKQQLGSVYWKLGDFQEASNYLNSAWTESTKYLEPQDPMTLHSASVFDQLRSKLDVLELAHSRAREAACIEKLTCESHAEDRPPEYSVSHAGQDEVYKPKATSATDHDLRYVDHLGPRAPMIANPLWYLGPKDVLNRLQREKTISLDNEIENLETENSAGVDDVPPRYIAQKSFSVHMESALGVQYLWRPKRDFKTILPEAVLQMIPQDILEDVFEGELLWKDSREQLSIVCAHDLAGERGETLDIIIQAIETAVHIYESHNLLTSLLFLRHVTILRLDEVEADFDTAESAYENFLLSLVKFDRQLQVLSAIGISRLSKPLISRFLRAEHEKRSFPRLLHQAVSLRLAGQVSTLLQLGADPHAVNPYNRTAIAYAIGRDPKPRVEESRHVMIKILMDFGCRPSLESAMESDDYLVVDFLMRLGASLDDRDEKGETLLHRAAKGDLAITKTLLKYGAKVAIASKEGNLPLHLAVRGSHVRITQTLLKYGAPTSAVNHQGSTPLHTAATNRDLPIIGLLMIYGADSAIKDNDGRSPINIAAEQGDTYLVDILTRECQLPSITPGMPLLGVGQEEDSPVGDEDSLNEDEDFIDQVNHTLNNGEHPLDQDQKSKKSDNVLMNVEFMFPFPADLFSQESIQNYWQRSSETADGDIDRATGVPKSSPEGDDDRATRNPILSVEQFEVRLELLRTWISTPATWTPPQDPQRHQEARKEMLARKNEDGSDFERDPDGRTKYAVL